MRRDFGLPQIARYLWAAPCTAVGLVPAALILLSGGSARIQSGVLEIAIRRIARRSSFYFCAITLGHVVIGRDERVLEQVRTHELEHVRQYECWGALFFVAYPASSLCQLLRGRNPYWFNHFEIESRKAEKLIE
ncbi:MAG: hypothetical protein WBO00_09865 [Steroidobacteraceae bacterium]